MVTFCCETEPVSDNRFPPAHSVGGQALHEPGGAAPSALRLLVVCCLVAGSGLLLVVTGSFLPWVVSGSVRRSSYAIVGLIDRLGVAGDGVIGVLIRNWPLAGVLFMTPVLAGCLRWWRTAGVLGVLVGLTSGVLAFGVLLLTTGMGGLGVRLDPVGPAVMAAGAILVLLGGVALASRAFSPVRRGHTRPNATHQS
jgi:hypothetical protein